MAKPSMWELGVMLATPWFEQLDPVDKDAFIKSFLGFPAMPYLVRNFIQN